MIHKHVIFYHGAHTLAQKLQPLATQFSAQGYQPHFSKLPYHTQNQTQSELKKLGELGLTDLSAHVQSEYLTLIRDIPVADSVYLVGHSLGARMALEVANFAEQRSHKIGGIGLLMPTAMHGDFASAIYQTPAILRSREATNRILFGQKHTSLPNTVYDYPNMRLRDDFFQGVTDIDYALNQDDVLPESRRVSKELFFWMLSSGAHKLHTLPNVPGIVIGAKYDPISPNFVTKRVAKQLQFEHELVPTCHMAPTVESQAQLCADPIMDFFNAR
jgi:pimeloyl-ACP methyl ester carboxylesterase